MNASEFVSCHMQNAPSLRNLIMADHTEDQAEDIIKSYNVVERLGADPRTSSSDLNALFSGYYLTSVQIGMLSFSDPVATAQGHQIGTYESDPVICDLSSGSIYVVDHSSFEHRMWICAKSGANFLDALCHVTAWIKTSYVDINIAEAVADEYVEECGRRAGGDEFKDFYAMMLGR